MAVRCTAQAVDVSKLPPPATRAVDFATDIRPIFERSCLRCHGPVRPKSGFRLDNRDAALKGGHSGNDILPGNSAESRLIHYVARLNPETAMPPEGKGEPLTPEQVGLLRAWIDQGAPWPDEKVEDVRLEFAPAVGFTTVSGNEAKFREHAWMRDGWRGGIERFELTRRFSADASLTLSGHALSDDYRADFLLEQHDLGFIRGGFEQFRKFDADTGGWFPDFSQPTFRLGRDLHLDVGRGWFDVGLTLPDWPRLLLGYELQYRNGEKSTLQWGPVSEGDRTRNIYPAFKRLHERTHILKFDLDYERNGWRAENQFRGEWKRLDTRQENVSRLELDAPASRANDSVRQGWRAFQGANTLRLERSFKDWLHASAGYLYSRLTADADFSLDTFNPGGMPLFPPVIQRIEWRSQRIVL
ncbi:MAG: c-type cytochrome domain-containing protein, partial [Verrucomicrobiales bacterium]|nr:c-type cytochrome domain-containing protein [Verrucomicrobiales bacterium]